MAIRKEYTEKFVMYGSTQTHSLGAKAALILGVPFRALPVKREDGYALRGDVLRAAVQEDIKNGLTPFCVGTSLHSHAADTLVGTVGTTSTGAVDYIAELGAVVREFDTMFMHVDAAWAGVAFALPECRAGLRQPEVSEFADSFCTNMHKWGLVGFDCCECQRASGASAAAGTCKGLTTQRSSSCATGPTSARLSTLRRYVSRRVSSAGARARR